MLDECFRYLRLFGDKQGVAAHHPQQSTGPRSCCAYKPNLESILIHQQSALLRPPVKEDANSAVQVTARARRSTDGQRAEWRMKEVIIDIESAYEKCSRWSICKIHGHSRSERVHWLPTACHASSCLQPSTRSSQAQAWAAS